MHLRRAPSIIVALLAALLVPGVAFAHAELVSSTPASGATVSTDPGTISATFSEAIDPGRSSMELLSPAGQTVATATVDASGTSMTLDHPALEPGTYTVRWTTVTPDDNGVERGTFTIIVAAAASATAASASSGASPNATPIPVDSQPATSPAASADPSSGSSGSGGATDVILPIAVLILAIGAILFLLRRRASA